MMLRLPQNFYRAYPYALANGPSHATSKRQRRMARVLFFPPPSR